MKPSVALLILVLGCGGKTREAGNDAAAGAPPTATTAPEFPIGQNPPSGEAGSGGGASMEPATCETPVVSCHLTGRSFIIVDDAGATSEMASPIDLGCASCRVTCEDCEASCEVYARGELWCAGEARIKVAVCAGKDQAPPCLNTAAAEPYYVDRTGKRWSVVSLLGSSSATEFPSELAGELELELRDGAGTRHLSLKARLCADLAQSLVVCK